MADSSVKGKSYAQLYQQYEQFKAEGLNSGNSQGAAKVLKALQSMPEHEIIKQLSEQLIALDRQIEEVTPQLELTEDEINAFMEKAIADIEPWYQQKVGDIEKSREEGRIQTAEVKPIYNEPNLKVVSCENKMEEEVLTVLQELGYTRIIARRLIKKAIDTYGFIQNKEKLLKLALAGDENETSND